MPRPWNPKRATPAGGSGSRPRTRTPGARRPSVWPPGATARWANGRGTDTTAHRLTPAGWSPPPAVPGSADRGSPHTETPGSPAWLWTARGRPRLGPESFVQLVPTGLWHPGARRPWSGLCRYGVRDAPAPHRLDNAPGLYRPGARWAVYLSPADKYHRLTRRLSQRAKRPIRESSHGLPAAL